MVFARDSFIKKRSSKPILKTTIEAVIITIMTTLITVLILWLYYVVYQEPNETRIYKNTIIQTAIGSMVAQYAYEYSGFNNMLAESSMRYAKNSTYEKYASRREATLYKCYYQLKMDGYNVDDNFNKLRLIFTRPRLAGFIADDIDDKLSEFDIKEVELLKTIPEENRHAIGVISERATESNIYDILVNGFADYKIADRRMGIELIGKMLPKLVDSTALNTRGILIAEKYKYHV